ncbi:MAG TPA: carbamate kinase [Anaerovoracaceae bacterium]|nr:carbamate kinase [Anaerovoracaceae bacterium]
MSRTKAEKAMVENKGRIVIALGGNALQEMNGKGTAEEQLSVVQKTCSYLADIVETGYQIVLVHGNGPQVGRILQASEAAGDVTPIMPFDVAGAMSQGYIGYHIQQALASELISRNISVPVVTVVTQVVVDENDPAFKNPTKPIGAFYGEKKAGKLAMEKGYVMKEDAGRGWRRVVASPNPERIVEIDSIRNLCKSSIVIAAGGGGIPVVKTAKGLSGVAAVIDKDFAAELLAEQLEADALLILTAVHRVSINYNTQNQKDLERFTVSEGEKYISEGHFAEGSMLPKVQAAIKFAKTNRDKKAIIASLYNAALALEGESGTQVVNNELL